MFKLVYRHITGHKVRSLLTMGSVFTAIFLLCLLRTLVTTLNAGVEAASSVRLIAQSAVSLFVELPIAYQDKIAHVEGVESVSKWQWFGGYYQDPSNFFAQFAVDQEDMFRVYPEFQLPEDQKQAFLSRRTACIVGDQIAQQFDWKVGQKIPLIGALFPHPSGADTAWEFDLVGIYHSATAALDNRTLFFRWDYFQQTREAGGETPNVGIYVVKVAPGSNVPRIMTEVDTLFENGPQRVRMTTEKEFQRQFVSMIGNVPMLVTWIGGGVLIAILLACVNSMLMAARQQVHDIGILKALGFTDAAAFTVMIAQALIVCGLGGALGIATAVAFEPAITAAIGTFFPGFVITQGTLITAATITLLLGLVSGIVPAWQSARLRCVEALRSTN
jgi:putative ABC transport system permease protein